MHRLFFIWAVLQYVLDPAFQYAAQVVDINSGTITLRYQGGKRYEKTVVDSAVCRNIGDGTGNCDSVCRWDYTERWR